MKQRTKRKFDSPSAASGVILGRNRQDWKDIEGRSLNEREIGEENMKQES